MEIKKTTDYEIFKKHESNRPLDEANVRRLMNSIQFKNLLALKPILVNAKLEIIDGQHRLEACKRLGEAIFYQVQPELKTEDILLVNNQKAWSSMDYLNFFVSQGYDDYIKLNKYLNKRNIKISQFITYLSSQNGNAWKNFRSGSFVYPPAEKIERFDANFDRVEIIKELIAEKKINAKSILGSTRFSDSLIEFMSDERVNFDILKKKIELNLGKLTPCANRVEYVKMLKDIYNWKNTNPLE